MVELLFKEESYKIVGACFEVYKEMGCGFVEAVYQECLELEFAAQNIPYQRHTELGLLYKSKMLNLKYKPDFILYDKIILELKALKDLAPGNRAQVYNYLRCTGYRLGLLVNFGHYPKLEYERIAL
ncbi:GxxExxY protein [soil metagenome]